MRFLVASGHSSQVIRDAMGSLEVSGFQHRVVSGTNNLGSCKRSERSMVSCRSAKGEMILASSDGARDIGAK